MTVALLDLPDARPGQTTVRTLYSGISTGTELLAYRGQLDPSLPLDETLGALQGTFAYPFRYGYSCVGRVEAGDDLPADTLVFAFHPHQDRFTVPTEELVALPAVDPRAATLLPLVETALQVVLDAGAVHRETVVVLGMGAVGMLVALLLQRAGAHVLGGEPRPGRRGVAASVGVEAVAPDELPPAVPLVIEASGSPVALASALDLLAHEGEVLVASWYGTQQVALPLGGAFHRRRLSIRSTQVSSIPSPLSARWTHERRRATVRALLSELPLTALATHTFPFEEAETAFAALDRGDDDIVHIALSYS